MQKTLELRPERMLLMLGYRHKKRGESQLDRGRKITCPGQHSSNALGGVGGKAR